MGIALALVMTLLVTPGNTPGGDELGPPNVLIIIADDLGVDRVAAYGEHPDPGTTPVIDQLAADGVLFRNAWANPVCSATRATMLTGRYSFSTGVGSFIPAASAAELSTAWNTIPKFLPPEYHKVAVGKWHLSGNLASYTEHPMLMGFDHHRGSMFNLIGSQGYFNWSKNTDGTLAPSSTYATTDAVDEAIGFISEYGAGPEPEPWFMWLAFNAPHTPNHHPPPALHTFDLPPQTTDPELLTKAMIEAMDTEIGRLLASIEPAVLANTYVIFIGDNGTGHAATTAPFIPLQGKQTIYEGGVNVPLIIKGPGVIAGAECAALVSSTDVFSTVADMAGVKAGTQDSTSLFPYLSAPDLESIRRWVYGEMFAPDLTLLPTSRQRTTRDARYKLHRGLEATGFVDRFYDLVADPFESTDLMAAGALSFDEQLAYDELDIVLDGLDPIQATTWVNLGYGLAGSAGVPALVGNGTLLANDPFSLRVTNASEFAELVLYHGVSYIVTPFKGGTLVPAPAGAIFGATNDIGTFVLAGAWPPGLPLGFTFYFQTWITDPLGPQGSSATNALAATTAEP